MPVMVNGRLLGVAQNGRFTSQNTAHIAGGALWTEAALTWNAMHAAFVADGGHPDEFRPGGPASSARSIAQQRHFYANQPPPAAIPGTSNHGWGIAVDCPSASAQAWLMRNGPRYGWSHDEGARVDEPWHFRYVGAPKSLRDKLSDPLAGYTAAEKRWIREFDAITRNHNRVPADAARLAVLRGVMTQQRKRLWKAAQDKHGWTPARRRRYKSLRARTT